MNHFLVVSGPTGVGKTDFVEGLASKIATPYVIINADVGQLYTPLTIGTAKPDYKSSPLKHYLFDVLTIPCSYTVSQWREAVLTLMEECWKSNILPVIVGGSSFYLTSLFFPPSQEVEQKVAYEGAGKSTTDLWKELFAVDQVRALSIHQNDRYRIERALALWYTQGKLPSLCKPIFEAPGTCSFYYLMRSKEELHTRINERVRAMMEQGWIEEVASLDSDWRDFLNKKKLIGYPEIIAYLQGEGPSSYEELIATIACKTRGYAKRQLVFWRMLKKRLESHDPNGNIIKKIVELHSMGPEGSFSLPTVIHNE